MHKITRSSSALTAAFYIFLNKLKFAAIMSFCSKTWPLLFSRVINRLPLIHLTALHVTWHEIFWGGGWLFVSLLTQLLSRRCGK